MENIKILKKDSYIILSFILIFIGSCIFFEKSLFWGFFFSIIFSLYKFIKMGFKFKNLKTMMISGINECKILYIVVLLIGANISVWLSSGVVPTMMFYGFKYMQGINFLFAAFIITSIISVFMGTAVGTISTIGLALLGVGKGFGIPSHIILGAIVSGAYMSDKISPISGLLNLTLTSVKKNYKETVKCMLITLLPAYIITAFIYYIIGRGFSVTCSSNDLNMYTLAINIGYFISPYLILLPIIVLIMSLSGFKTISCILVGLVGGSAFSFIFQDMSISNILNCIIFGYHAHTSSLELNKVLISGGVVSMIEVILIVIEAIALSSILEGTSLTTALINDVIVKIKTKGELILKTGIISSILTIITCDQTVGIILPARLIKNKYDELDVDHTVLGRTISDTGTIIAPLMPWNVNGIIIFIISGISATAYAPYAIFCYICPIVSVLISYEFKILSKRTA